MIPSGDTMRIRLRHLLLLLFLTGNTHGAEESFTVKIDRPPHKGDRRNFELVFAEVTTIRTQLQGSEPKSDEIASGARLAGSYEAVNVDSDGYSLENRITVAKFTRTATDGTENDVLPAGTTIVARVGAGKKPVTEFKVDGVKPQGEVLKILGDLLTISPPQDSKQFAQMLTGTQPEKLRHVGDSWPIDALAAAKLFKRAYAGSGNPRDITGEVKLVGVETTNQQRCLHLQANVRATNLVTPRPTTQSLAFKAAQSDTLYEGWFPAKEDEPQQRSSYSISASMTGEGEHDGQKARSDVSLRREVRIRLLPDDRTVDPKPTQSKRE